MRIYFQSGENKSSDPDLEPDPDPRLLGGKSKTGSNGGNLRLCWDKAFLFFPIRIPGSGSGSAVLISFLAVKVRPETMRFNSAGFTK